MLYKRLTYRWARLATQPFSNSGTWPLRQPETQISRCVNPAPTAANQGGAGWRQISGDAFVGRQEAPGGAA